MRQIATSMKGYRLLLATAIDLAFMAGIALGAVVVWLWPHIRWWDLLAIPVYWTALHFIDERNLKEMTWGNVRPSTE